MDEDLFGPGVDVWEVLATAAFIAGLTLLSVLVYKAMERPRLTLTRTPDGLRAKPRDVVKYAVSIPFLTTLWIVFFSLVLFVAPVQSSARTQLLMPIAIVIAIRFLAHVNLAGAYHLSSVLPMVILASLVLGEGLPDEADIERLADESQGVEVAAAVFFLVYLLEYLFTLVWYGVKRTSGEVSSPEVSTSEVSTSEVSSATAPLDPAQQRRELDAHTTPPAIRDPDQVDSDSS